MGMNLECMLYLQKKGILTNEKNKILDIGPQNVYDCTFNQIEEFVTAQGGDVSSSSFTKKAQSLEYFSTPRPEERTTLFSEITDLTNIEYRALDVCPAFKTELLDLNFDTLPKKHRERYDLVLNFGTTEHVFNQWNSFEIIHNALKVGGVLYCVLPASGYLSHGYYCYTPLFFRDLAAANQYEILDFFFAQAGEERLRALGADIRREGEFLLPYSASLRPDDDKVPCFNTHVVMRKTSGDNFTCGLEVATAHSEAKRKISARYNSEMKSSFLKNEMAPLIPKMLTPQNHENLGIDQLRAACERLEREKQARIAERDQLRTERDKLTGQLSIMQASRSWRITKPLRMFSSRSRIFQSIVSKSRSK